MSYAITLLAILFGINLMLFLVTDTSCSAESCEIAANAPMLTIVKAVFFGGSIDWGRLISTLGQSAWVYVILVGIIITMAYATGASPLGGGGHGALVVFPILAIGIFSSLLLLPNFSALNFPMPVLVILNLFFGFMITISVIGLFRGE